MTIKKKRLVCIFPRHEGKTFVEYQIDEWRNALEEDLLPTLEQIREKKRQKFQRRKHEITARNSKSKS